LFNIIKEPAVSPKCCKQILSLTPKGRKRVKEMKPIWKTVQQAAEELCTESNNDFIRL
jgi:DNA-binding PadR family transcriptional regulator